MRVPMLDLPRLHAPLRSELLAAVARVLDSGRLVLGDEVAACEAEMAALSGARFAVGVSSGSDALLLTLMALGIGPGDEVVTPALSFFATAGAVARLGARPVFCEVGEDFQMEAEDALGRVTSRTRALLPVSLFGRRVDCERLRARLPDSVAVVEDAAQAVGMPGVGRGTRAATLSFFPSKNLGALGDGGMMLTDDAELAERLRLLRSHGARPKYHHLLVGGNFRLDAVQAAALRVKLPHLSAWNEARRRNARVYLDALADLGSERLRLPEDEPGCTWHQFVVRLAGRARRDRLRAFLAEREIETEVYYPEPLHLQPCFAALGHQPGELPRAEALCEQALALPVHPALDEAQRAHVVESVRAFFDRSEA